MGSRLVHVASAVAWAVDNGGLGDWLSPDEHTLLLSLVSIMLVGSDEHTRIHVESRNVG
eukprot:m.133300 g.133300  ORF g.133300 m.133300 type:complete len:59 (-) comp11354_c0_seq4:636-812(-)